MVSGPILDQITQLLHQELSKKSAQNNTRPRLGSAVAGNDQQQRQLASDPSTVLRTRIETLMRSGVTDEAVLVRAAVEFLLQREFGTHLANTHSFQEMTDQVSQTLLQDNDATQALSSALKRSNP